MTLLVHVNLTGNPPIVHWGYFLLDMWPGWELIDFFFLTFFHSKIWVYVWNQDIIHAEKGQLNKQHPGKLFCPIPLSSYLILPVVDDRYHRTVKDLRGEGFTLFYPMGPAKGSFVLSNHPCWHNLNLPLLKHHTKCTTSQPVGFHGVEGHILVQRIIGLYVRSFH